jgi:hypothetical protein
MGRIYHFYRMDDFSDRGLARLFSAFDLLHDYASDGHLVEATNLNSGEIVGWLEDILFTIDETIREIDAHEARQITRLSRLVKAELEGREEIES